MASKNLAGTMSSLTMEDNIQNLITSQMGPQNLERPVARTTAQTITLIDWSICAAHNSVKE